MFPEEIFPPRRPSIPQVCRVERVDFIRLDPGVHVPFQGPPPWHGVKGVLESNCFYYSPDPKFDLTSRVSSARLAEPPVDVPHDPHFTFNRFILEPIIQAMHYLPDNKKKIFVARGFVLPCIQGEYARQMISLRGETCYLAVVTRISPDRSGTRFHRRGLDTDGNAAIFAEVRLSKCKESFC